MRKRFHFTHVPGGFKTEQEFQEYLQISQNARIVALQARREAMDAFWTGLGRAVHRLGRNLSASVVRDRHAHAAHSTEEVPRCLP
jgi:hypothetical protein